MLADGDLRNARESRDLGLGQGSAPFLGREVESPRSDPDGTVRLETLHPVARADEVHRPLSDARIDAKLGREARDEVLRAGRPGEHPDLAADDLRGEGDAVDRHPGGLRQLVEASRGSELLRGQIDDRRDDRIHRPAAGQPRLDRLAQDARGPLSEVLGQTEAGGEARELHQTRGQGPLHPVVAGPMAHAPKAVQGRNAPCVDRVAFRVAQAVPHHGAEALVRDHDGRRRAGTDPVFSLERGPVRALIHEGFVEDETARVAHPLPADRIHVQGEAAAVRTARGVVGPEVLPREVRLEQGCLRDVCVEIPHACTFRVRWPTTHLRAQCSSPSIASDRSSPISERWYSTATGRSRRTRRSARPESSSSLRVFARELWHIAARTRSSLNRFGPDIRLWSTLSLSSDPMISIARRAGHSGLSQGAVAFVVVTFLIPWEAARLYIVSFSNLVLETNLVHSSKCHAFTWHEVAPDRSRPASFRELGVFASIRPCPPTHARTARSLAAFLPFSSPSLRNVLAASVTSAFATIEESP